MHIDAARGLIPGLVGTNYLDFATAGLLPAPATYAMTALLEDHATYGSVAAPRWLSQLLTHRSTIARLIGGQASNIAFTQNTSTGLALVTNGLDWRPGDNVVVPAIEFPSNRYPWLALRRLGVEVRAVPSARGYAAISDLGDAVDGRTRVVTVSAVQFSSGYRYDLSAVREAARDALFVVDGSQSVGAMLTDVVGDEIDVLATTGHKWMLGPLGVGFVHFSDRAMDELVPSTPGWRSVEDPYAFSEEPRDADDARRFESGTENLVGITGLSAAIQLLLDVGTSTVEDAVLRRAEELVARLAQQGQRPAVELPQGHTSGIVVVAHDDPTTARARLAERGVICTARATGLRLSPHFFTSSDDLKAACEALADLAR